MSGIEPGQHDDEFIAAKACHGIAFTHRGGQALRNRLQQLVAGIVAQRVVDALEVIKIQEQAGHLGMVALSLGQYLFQPVVEQRPVGQSGQYVVLRELVGMRGGDLEFLGALRDLVLEVALVGRHLRLRFREALRHVIERMRQQARFIGGTRRHVDIQATAAHGARRTRQSLQRGYQAARQQLRRNQCDQRQEAHHREGTDQP